MSEATSPTPASACPRCGAIRTDGAEFCWLCNARFTEDAPLQLKRRPVGAPQPVGFSISTLLLIMTVCAILFALIAAAPGLGVFLAIFLVPVVVRTTQRVSARERAGLHVSTGQKLALGATSLVSALLLAAVVGFTTFCCFCSVCAFLFGADSGDAEVLMMALAAFAGAIGGVFAIRGLIRLRRRRIAREDHMDFQ